MGHEGREPVSVRAEFESAVFPHLETMARLARSLLRGNQADAEDLVQDAALRAFRAFPRFQPGTNLRAWLFRILRNTYVDLLRRKGRRAELAESLETAPENDLAFEEFRAQATRERAEADLEAVLSQLPAELRMVLLLVDGEGMRYDEVAEVMECPVGTIRSRGGARRAGDRRRLRPARRTGNARPVVPRPGG